MATRDPRMPDPPVQPLGAEGDGLDTYPTYRDSGTTPHVATTTKPTDVGLAPSRRTYSLPMLIGLVAVAVIILFVIFRGGAELATSDDGAANDGAASPATATAPSEPAATATEEGALDPNVKGGSTTGPATVAPEPGAVDVPGGAATDATPAPQ